MKMTAPKTMWAVLIMLLPALCGYAQGVPERLQLFLLIGQSNMAGRGKVTEQDRETNPHIFMLNKQGAWVPARDPVHFDKPVAGVGLCSQFARDVLKARPGIDIGLIPCAVGGTSLDQWKPGDKLYTEAVARARVAMQRGTLAGILWHQGEADSRSDLVATYPERFAAMIGALRKELAAEQAPLVVGELIRSRPNHGPFNAMLPRLAEKVPLCAVATSEDLVPLPGENNPHFDTPSLHLFGSRYAAAFLKLQAPVPAAVGEQAAQTLRPVEKQSVKP